MKSGSPRAAWRGAVLLLLLAGVSSTAAARFPAARRHRFKASGNVALRAKSACGPNCLGTPNSPCPVPEPTHWLIRYESGRTCPPPTASNRVCQPIYADSCCHTHEDGDGDKTYVLAAAPSYPGAGITVNAGTAASSCGCMAREAKTFTPDECVDHGASAGTSVKLVTAEDFAMNYQHNCGSEDADILDGASCPTSSFANVSPGAAAAQAHLLLHHDSNDSKNDAAEDGGRKKEKRLGVDKNGRPCEKPGNEDCFEKGYYKHDYTKDLAASRVPAPVRAALLVALSAVATLY